MPQQLVLVLGATNLVGRAAIAHALSSGHRVRVVTRHANAFNATTREQLDSVVIGDLRDAAVRTVALTGVDAVISSAGGSVKLGLGHGWRGYHATDTALHAAVIPDAIAAKVKRFIYVSVFTPTSDGKRLAYVDAHERVADMLVGNARAMPDSILRSTGFFSAFATLLPLAKRGVIPLIGDGTARTNPISDEDLGRELVNELAASENRQREVGGPQIFTRTAINNLVIATAARNVRVMRVPARLACFGSACARPFHPRLSQLGSFFAYASTHDCIAPIAGTQQLADFLARVS